MNYNIYSCFNNSFFRYNLSDSNNYACMFSLFIQKTDKKKGKDRGKDSIHETDSIDSDDLSQGRSGTVKYCL